MRTRLMHVMLSALVAAGLTLVASPATSADAAPTARVVTSGGALSGFSKAGVTEYLGVPFGASTGGTNRFMPPRPAAPWRGVRAATQHGPQCPQNSPLPYLPELQRSSEDCLSVDLYVPNDARGKNLPVMVYLFGGAYNLGSNAQYDGPTQMVARGDVIVAIPNYRVGPFGFLALPELAARSGGAAGTYGTMDQQLAMRWVQRNARAFGGNPDNITIYGESAGGMSVCTQIASPLAAGLFHKAIVQSGSCARSPLVPPTKPVAYQRSTAYAASMGCTDATARIACLRGLPVSRLLDSPTARFDSLEVTWTPIIDGVVLTRTPEDALRAGVARDIPIIAGSNTDEGALFVALQEYALGRIPSPSSYRAWARNLFGADGDAVVARYPVTSSTTPAQAQARASTDALFACPSLFTNEAARRGGGNIWQYELAQAPLGANPVLPGAFHGADVGFLFSSLMGLPIPWTGASARLADRLQQQWVQFARTGSPDRTGLPAWRQFDGTDPAALHITTERSQMTTGFARAHQCAFWREADLGG